MKVAQIPARLSPAEALSMSATSTIAAATTLYNALQSQTVAAYQTTNNTLLFMFVAVGALLSVAAAFLFGDSGAGLLAAATTLLAVVPITVFLMYIVWFREQLRILRDSSYLIGIELRVSKLVHLVNKKMSDTFADNDPIFVSKYLDIFPNGAMSWEYWLRGSRKNRTETGPVLIEGWIFYLVTFALMFVVAGSIIIGLVFVAACSVADFQTSTPPTSILLRRYVEDGWRMLWPAPKHSFVMYNLALSYLTIAGATSLVSGLYIRSQLRTLEQTGLDEADKWPQFEGASPAQESATSNA